MKPKTEGISLLRGRGSAEKLKTFTRFGFKDF
jgi:hypothetical protein